MPKVLLSCTCGKIKGYTENITAKSGNRINCCCIDCQNFATYLQKEEQILDEYGGTDIFQIPLSHLKISQGIEHIACMRFTEKGLYRWYANCCNTPIGNTLGSKAPFIGVIHNFMQNTSMRDADLGQSLGTIHWHSAKLPVPDEQKASFLQISTRILAKLISWKIRGLNKPSVFFDNNGRSIVKPSIMNTSSKD